MTRCVQTRTVATEVPIEEVRAFLLENRLDPRHQQFLAAEAVASHFGVPIYYAQTLVRGL